jgi:hypothetical protein
MPKNGFRNSQPLARRPYRTYPIFRSHPTPSNRRLISELFREAISGLCPKPHVVSSVRVGDFRTSIWHASCTRISEIERWLRNSQLSNCKSGPNSKLKHGYFAIIRRCRRPICCRKGQGSLRPPWVARKSRYARHRPTAAPTFHLPLKSPIGGPHPRNSQSPVQPPSQKSDTACPELGWLRVSAMEQIWIQCSTRGQLPGSQPCGLARQDREGTRHWTSVPFSGCDSIFKTPPTELARYRMV